MPAITSARLAGLLYLTVIACGIFAEFLARGQVMVTGDPGATAQALSLNEELYRAGFAIKILYLIAYVAAGAILLELTGGGRPLLRRTTLGLLLVAMAVEGANLIVYAVPLVLLQPEAAMAAMSLAERAALSYGALQLFTIGFAISLVYFGAFCLGVGALIRSSGALPPSIGWLMSLAGLSYLVNSLAIFLDLKLGIGPLLLLPPLVAELALALWLTIRGARTEGDADGVEFASYSAAGK